MWPIVLAVFIILAVSFTIVIVLAILWKVWTADQEKAREYRALKKLVGRANKGDKTARSDCENNPLIRMKISPGSSGLVKRKYSVPDFVLLQVFGHY